MSALSDRDLPLRQVLALVSQTGFMTSKGELVRSILYPPPVDFELEQDTYKFVGLLACVATIGVIYSTYTKVLPAHRPRHEPHTDGVAVKSILTVS